VKEEEGRDVEALSSRSLAGTVEPCEPIAIVDARHEENA